MIAIYTLSFWCQLHNLRRSSKIIRTRFYKLASSLHHYFITPLMVIYQLFGKILTKKWITWKKTPRKIVLLQFQRKLSGVLFDVDIYIFTPSFFKSTVSALIFVFVSVFISMLVSVSVLVSVLVFCFFHVGICFSVDFWILFWGLCWFLGYLLLVSVFVSIPEFVSVCYNGVG